MASENCENCKHLTQKSFEPWYHYQMPSGGIDFYYSIYPKWGLIKTEYEKCELESNHFCGQFERRSDGK